jgi:hypothetical protein
MYVNSICEKYGSFHFVDIKSAASKFETYEFLCNIGPGFAPGTTCRRVTR